MRVRAQEPEFVFRQADGAEPQGDVLSALADLLIDLNDRAGKQETQIHSPPDARQKKKPRTTGARGRMPPSHGQ